MYGSANDGHGIFRNNENGVVACMATKRRIYQANDDGGLHGSTKIAFMPYSTERGVPIEKSVDMITNHARELVSRANQNKWGNDSIAAFADKRAKEAKLKLAEKKPAEKKPTTKRIAV